MHTHWRVYRTRVRLTEVRSMSHGGQDETIYLVVHDLSNLQCIRDAKMIKHPGSVSGIPIPKLSLY